MECFSPNGGLAPTVPLAPIRSMPRRAKEPSAAGDKIGQIDATQVRRAQPDAPPTVSGPCYVLSITPVALWPIAPPRYRRWTVLSSAAGRPG